MIIGKRIHVEPLSLDINGTPHNIKGGEYMEVWPQSVRDIFLVRDFYRKGDVRADFRPRIVRGASPILVAAASEFWEHSKSFEYLPENADDPATVDKTPEVPADPGLAR